MSEENIANSFNPMSGNSEIVLIWQYRRVVSGPEVLLFTGKKVPVIKQADLRNMFKQASKSICT
jgi:hypothetical protein